MSVMRALGTLAAIWFCCGVVIAFFVIGTRGPR